MGEQLLDYNGRTIVIGAISFGNPFMAYWIEGRKPSSQARKLVLQNNSISTVSTDERKTLL